MALSNKICIICNKIYFASVDNKNKFVSLVTLENLDLTYRQIKKWYKLNIGYVSGTQWYLFNYFSFLII